MLVSEIDSEGAILPESVAFLTWHGFFKIGLRFATRATIAASHCCCF